MRTPKFYWLILAAFFLFPALLIAKEYDPRLLQASRLAYQGSWSEGLKLVEQYMQENPLDPNGLFVKGVILETKLALSGEMEGPAQRKMLEVYQEANDMAYQLWYRDQENIDKMIDLGNSYLFLARKYSDVGDNLKAVLTGKKCQKHLEKALKMDPTRVDALLALGGFHYIADTAPPGVAAFKSLLGISGTKAQGLAELKKALTGNHPFIYEARYIFYYLNFEFEKNYDEANKNLDILIQQFPENPELRLRRARVYERKDLSQGAEEFVKFVQWCETKGEKCKKHYLFMGNYKAGLMYKQLGNKEKAKTYLAKSLNYNAPVFSQQMAEALYWTGQMEQAEGKYPDAIEKYQKAKSLPGIPGSLRSEIEKTLGQACQADANPNKC